VHAEQTVGALPFAFRNGNGTFIAFSLPLLLSAL
jgi:hypothetical protein